MVVLEAWAYRKPVLMTDECNIPSGFCHNAAIRIEPNAEDITRGIVKLLDQSESDRIAMGDKGEALVKADFSWEKIGAMNAALINWIVNGASVPSFVTFE